MEERPAGAPEQMFADMSEKPRGHALLKKTVVVVFIAVAALLLFGGIGAFYLWKVTEQEYSSINLEMLEENILEVSSEDEPENRALELQDFKAGITALRFPTGDKCFIKSHVTPEFTEVRDVLSGKLDVRSLIWISSEEAVKDDSFLSPEILRFCGDLPIYWQHPANARGSAALRKRRNISRVRRQARERPRRRNSTAVREETEFNPENPYHRNQGEEEGTMTFDPMLDHLGICCTECQRSHTHCQRVCEPHGGYWPWPYHYHGCRSVCRVIMPCRWWAARIMGLV